MSLVPPDLLVDARNDRPHLSFFSAAELTVEVHQGWASYDAFHRAPYLELTSRPRFPRPFAIEAWVEKTTVNDVLFSLARDYELSVVTASGEMSAIACRQFVDRAIEYGRPVRILYVSDFDPAGRSMPVAMARKVEFELDRRQVQLDIQVRAVALTHEQCIAYRLPRAPIKETERRAARFEERFGEGATELDALEALHPGALRRILEKEIRRYWNPDHDTAVNRAIEDFEDKLDAIEAEVKAEFNEQLAALYKQERALSKSLPH